MIIGWSKISITPNTAEKVTLLGQSYIREATGVQSDLFATVCVVENVAIVSMDAISVPSALIRDIDKNRFGLGNIIYCATHTHEGPSVTIGVGYYTFLKNSIEKAIGTAIKNSQPGCKISFGYQSAVTGRVRRVKMFEIPETTRDWVNTCAASTKNTVLYYDTQRAPEKFEGLSGDTNCLINSLYTFDSNNELTGIIANVPCPAQCLEHSTLISADYWSIVREQINEHFGRETYVLPLCGASGDNSPHFVVNRKQEERRHENLYGTKYDYSHGTANQTRAMCEMKDIGTTITNTLLEIYDWAKNDLIDTREIEYQKVQVNVDVNYIDSLAEQQYTERIQSIERFLSQPRTPKEIQRANIGLKNAQFNHEKRSKVPNTKVASSSILQIGPCAFVFLGFEVFSDFGHEIDVNSPFLQTFVVQNASELGGGYLSSQHHLDESGYSSSWENPINSDGGKIFVQSVVSKLRDMYRNDIERRQIELPERTVLANELFRTFNDMVGAHIHMQDNDSYKVECECEDEHVITLFEPATDLVDAPYLEEGVYALYGCEMELTDASKNTIMNVDAVDNSYQAVWTKFELATPQLVTRICIPMKVGSYNNVYVPVLKKLDSMSDELPVVDCSGEHIEFRYLED